MNFLVIGAGNIGSGIALNLLEAGHSVDVADKSMDSLNRLKKINEKIRVIEFDVFEKNSYRILHDYEVILSALPGSIGMEFLRNAAITGNTVVDVSYTDQNPYELNDTAMASGTLIVPDMGFAPGLTNAIVGHLSCDLEKVNNVKIYVGGIPEKPIPPIDYTITWSVEGLIDEYTRPVHIVRNGIESQVQALSGIEKISIGNYVNMEAFYTDGLRSLIRNIKCTEMFEKTIRYPGHAEKISLLKDLGYFDRERIHGCNITAFDVSEQLFMKKLFMPDVHDVVLMRIDVSGIKSESEINRSAEMQVYYDSLRNRTAMDIVTSLPASITAEFLSKNGKIATGMVFPETLGVNDNYFNYLIGTLQKNSIKISIK